MQKVYYGRSFVSRQDRLLIRVIRLSRFVDQKRYSTGHYDRTNDSQFFTGTKGVEYEKREN